MQLKCKGYHYLVNGQNIWLEDKLDVNKFISKEEFELAITPDKNDNDYDKLVSKLAVHMGTRNKITGKFVDLYFFRNAIIVIIMLAFTSCGTYQYSSGGNGCGAWWPKKFEKDKRAMRMAKESRWRNSHR